MKLQTIWVVSAVGLAALAACKQIGTSEMKNKELEMLLPDFKTTSSGLGAFGYCNLIVPFHTE